MPYSRATQGSWLSCKQESLHSYARGDGHAMQSNEQEQELDHALDEIKQERSSHA